MSTHAGGQYKWSKLQPGILAEQEQGQQRMDYPSYLKECPVGWAGQAVRPGEQATGAADGLPG
jgi:hypothetical protein